MERSYLVWVEERMENKERKTESMYIASFETLQEKETEKWDGTERGIWDLRRVFVQVGYYSMFIDDGMVMRENTDEGESRKTAGAKYLKPVRSNRAHVWVKALAFDKSKDS